MKSHFIVGVIALNVGIVIGLVVGRVQAHGDDGCAAAAFLQATEVAGAAAASLEMLGDSENARLEGLLSQRLRTNLAFAYAQMDDVTSVDVALPNLIEAAARVERLARSKESFQDLADQAGRVHAHLEALSAAAI